MTAAALVKSGRDLVAAGTGEVVGEVQTFSMVEYLASVTTPASLEAQKKLAAAYDKACDSLIGENDVQKDGGRTFKKKSAWAKLGRHFNISTVVVSAQKEMLGETFCATVTVKAIAPWGQSAEGVGACATDEESGRRTITIADAIATAETRAHNRAISRLIAMGEVSAEEMDKSGAKSPIAKPAAEKLMPFGDSKGKKLGDMHDEELDKVLTWCQSKGKFPDLAIAITEVLASRSVESEELSDEDQADYDSTLPF
jgi:uncharacterized protein (DUF3820 family)